ncbi:MAG: hypothetical protein GVY33_03045 [Alphaproteobacteria bacterium]|nr:hypothetical protein [Alphaproteobacteria bacterium]
MSVRRVLAGLLVLVLTAPGLAADRVVGRWVLDEAAFRAQVERFYAEALAQVPAEDRDRAEAMAERAIDATVERMAGAAVTFEPDGTVVLDAGDGPARQGRWSRQGDTIVVEPTADGAEATTLVGLFEDDRLRLEPDREDAVGFVMRRPAE